MINVIVDTGFWFGYCTPKDEHHQKALDIFSYLLKIDSDLSFIIPYPSLYETLNTKFLRSGNKEGRDWFLEQLEFNPSFIKYDDSIYKDIAYQSTLNDNYRGLSLVDNYIRALIQDLHDRINAVLSFNTNDFRDLCALYQIDLLDDSFTEK